MSIMFEIINVMKANKIKACLLCECAQSNCFRKSAIFISIRVSSNFLNVITLCFRMYVEANYFMFPQTNEKEMKLLRVN